MIRAVGAPVRRLLSLGAVLAMAATGLLMPVAPAQAQSNPTITLTSDFSSVSERDGEIWWLNIKATLDGGARSTATTVSVSISADGTATRGTDYQATLQGPITIAENESSASAKLTLNVSDDTDDEGDETIIVEGEASGFTVNPVTITLEDDDYPSTSLTLTASPARLAESAGATSVTVTAELDAGPLEVDKSVSLALAGGAESPGDYTFAPAALPSLTIAAGSRSKSATITIDPVFDDVADSDEQIIVDGTVVGDATFGVTDATITLYEIPLPGAVTDLIAWARNNTEMWLRWTVPSGPIDSYRLQRRHHEFLGWGPWQDVSPGPEFSNVERDLHLDSGLRLGRRYEYRIFARNVRGEGPVSNVVWAYTLNKFPEQGTDPSAPSGPSVPSGGGAPVESVPESESEQGLVFEDVDASSALAGGIARAVELGIFEATSPGLFSPELTMSRVDMAAPLVGLWRALGRSCPQEPAMPFGDVVGAEARADVACLYGLGIANGTTATTFSPDRGVTRAQVASLLVRLWRLAGGECPAGAVLVFEDVAPDSVHRDDIVCLHALGVTNGTTAVSFSPEGLVTRGEVATLAVRLHDQIASR